MRANSRMSNARVGIHSSTSRSATKRGHGTTPPSRSTRGNATMAIHSLDILFRPTQAWQAIANDADSATKTLLTHTAPSALVPAASWYYGVTQVGWSFGHSAVQTIAPASAAKICALFYLAMIAGVAFLGFVVHWMAATYGALRSSFARGVAVVSFTATP